MTRPATPELHKGDEMFMHSGTPGRRDGKSWSAVRVVTVGRKYVHVISAKRYADPLPEAERWYVRKFLIEDMEEGDLGRRVGYTASLATREQMEFDVRLDTAMALVRNRAGLDLRYDSPFAWREHPERLIALACAVTLLLDQYESEDGDDR